MKHRLGEPAMTAPGVAFGAEQALAGDEAHLPRAPAVARVVRRPGVQHLAHERRVGDEMIDERAEAQAHHRAAVGGGAQEAERVAPERGRMTGECPARG